MKAAFVATKTPFTVLGGFLGAGKTTLVNHLLRHATGRYAVLVNDFGAVNVDADLIAAHDGETLRLNNGCVCCSLNGDFVMRIANLLDSGEAFEHVFVEASGVGDPWAIAEIALVEPQLALNMVLVVADAERVETWLRDPRVGDTASRQIAAADVVLLNKCDLVNEVSRNAAARAISAIKPDVRIIETRNANIPVDLIEGAERPVSHSRFRSDTPPHEETFQRFLFRHDGCFDEAKLRTVLKGLPPDLLRLKGFCRIGEGDTPNVLQWVGGRTTLASTPASPTDVAIELVGIGTRTFDPQALTRRLESALYIAL